MTNLNEQRKMTSEDLAKRFDSPFDLVNYAIACGENLLRSGRNPRVKTTIHNPAYVVLTEIREGVDYITEEENYSEEYDNSAMIQATQWQDPTQRAAE